MQVLTAQGWFRYFACTRGAISAFPWDRLWKRGDGFGDTPTSGCGFGVISVAMAMDGRDYELADLAERVERIGQAVTIVAAQAGCSSDEALSRMSRIAVDTDETVAYIASCVLDGIIRFDP